jgi:hypothetical protein
VDGGYEVLRIDPRVFPELLADAAQ